MHPAPRTNRRDFLRAGAGVLAAAWAGPALLRAAAPRPLFSARGIAAPLASAAVLKAAGADYLTESVGSFLVPDQPEEAFAAKLAAARAAPLPVLACNGFIRPANLRCVGAEANPDQVLAWADTTFRRARVAGVRLIVFGSAGARQLKDGWPRERADEQFRALLRALGPLAERHGVTVVLEQLRREECNYINHVAEAAAAVRAAGHPRVRLLADLYHMASVGDTPADLAAAMDVVAHIEIAEVDGRTVPGVHGQDFRPFFRVLRSAGYSGMVNIEGKWTPGQVAPAFAEIDRQSAEAQAGDSPHLGQL